MKNERNFSEGSPTEKLVKTCSIDATHVTTYWVARGVDATRRTTLGLTRFGRGDRAHSGVDDFGPTLGTLSRLGRRLSQDFEMIVGQRYLI